MTHSGLLVELSRLREKAAARVGAEDLAHLRKIERWGWLASALGFATAWVFPNPLSAAALSLGRSTRWLMMHHVGHRAYDRIPGAPARYTSQGFGAGWRRLFDWPDWMTPEAWKHEHNVLHHGFTGQERDPDLLERNAQGLRERRLPLAVVGVLLFFLGASWRASYYAPSTMRQWVEREERRAGLAPSRARYYRALLLRCYLPYALFSFVLLPLCFSPLGAFAVFSVFCNLLLAEVLTNLHTFLVVGPNHTGEDLYRFRSAPATREEYYLWQILGSANYRTGGDLNDYLHLWLNYQIEHHLWPDLPMLRYRELQPEVRRLCARYGIPYVQESVWTRFWKLWRVVAGASSMRWAGHEGAARAGEPAP